MHNPTSTAQHQGPHRHSPTPRTPPAQPNTKNPTSTAQHQGPHRHSPTLRTPPAQPNTKDP
ncbi:hypothetical protein LSAT2_027928, partial [Lamellibrachia satsuma]